MILAALNSLYPLTAVILPQKRPRTREPKEMPKSNHIADTSGSQACYKVLDNTDLLEMVLLYVAGDKSCFNLCALFVSQRTRKGFRATVACSYKLQRALWLQADLSFHPADRTEPSTTAIRNMELNPMLGHMWIRLHGQCSSVDIWNAETKTWDENRKYDSSKYQAVLDFSAPAPAITMRVLDWNAEDETGGSGSWRRMQIYRGTNPGIDTFVSNGSKSFGRFHCATAETVEQVLKKVKRELGHCACGMVSAHKQEDCQTRKTTTA